MEIKEVCAMPDKIQKRIIYGFLGAVVLYCVGMSFFVWNSKSPANRNIQMGRPVSSQPGPSYEASYTLNGNKISVTVPAQQGVGLKAARNIAAVSIRNTANQLGLALPEGFESDIALVPEEKQP